MSYAVQIWNFRGFILGSVKRELQARYRNSVLGTAWVVLPAIAQIVVYTLIFSKLVGARLPGVNDQLGYSIYLCSGIIAWGLHSDVVSRCSNVFVENGNMIKKLVFPRICLPAIVVSGATINFLIISALFLTFLASTGRFPGFVFIHSLPFIAVQLMFAASLGIFLGVTNVFFRDVGQLTQIALTFWFWLTPIVYPLEVLPDAVQRLVSLNPMTVLVGGYQDIYVYHQSPNWLGLFVVASFAVLLALGSLAVYRRKSADMVDEL